MKKYLAFKNFILLFLVIGVPNYFVVYDATNSTETISIDFNIIVRAGLFLLVSLYIFLFFFCKRKVNKRAVYVCLIPVLFYLFYLVGVLLEQSGVELLKSTYRIAEYLIFFLFLLVYQSEHGRLTTTDLTSFFDSMFKYILLILFIGVVFFNSKIFGYVSFDDGYFRLGGSVIHPNTLGTLSAIAVLFYFFVSVSSYRYFLVLCFLVILFLTYSRGALISCFLGVFIPYVCFSRHRFLYALCFTIFALFLTYFAFDDLLSVLARGQGAEGIINMSGRLVVWQSSVDIIFSDISSLIFGISFGESSSIVGAVMEDSYGIDYWKSHNAHNDFIQAWLSGGVFYFGVTLYLYINMILNCLSIKLRNIKMFVMGTVVVLFIFSVSMTTINYYFSVFSSLIWIVYVYLNSNRVVSYGN